jgi:hypothetical protein
LKTIEDYDRQFVRIADCLMNEYLLTVNGAYKYRISEIEFYYNDVHDKNSRHPDTFTHGDEMQKLSGRWYFHRFGKTYKTGTYKGMDLSFGKGDVAFGGILIRAINSVGACNGKNLQPNEFIEGPCNSVTRILEHNSASEANPIKEVKDFVILDNFTTDAFTEGSRLFLSRISEEDLKKFNLDWKKSPQGKSPLYRGPRVGLTLKRFDEHKCNFWMKDYRFVVYPEKHRKQQILVMLGMLGNGFRADQVTSICKTKKTTVDELVENMNKGSKSDQKITNF